jgi:hypothetical protein
VRASRKENLLLRAAYALFYRLLRWIANIDIPLDAGDFLPDGPGGVVDVLTAMPERKPVCARAFAVGWGMKQIGFAV